ncbi:MAG: SRPBCC family protein [Armatimonadetes bacterium]|nr:SRPBCC family protein [Armatimonadota bacterium]
MAPESVTLNPTQTPMPRITTAIHVDAPPDRVYAVAREAERFPEFMPDVKSTRVEERSPDGRRLVVAWEALIPEFKVTIKWVEEDHWDPQARRCDFRLVRGDFKAYSGAWQFFPEDGGTRFESVLDYEIEIPLIGPLIRGLIARKMRENVEKLLRALKNRAEEG